MRQNKVEYYKDKNNEWRWRVKAPNGNTLADSSEGYKNREDARAGFISSQRTTVPNE